MFARPRSQARAAVCDGHLSSVETALQGAVMARIMP
jgi:hypothetical protein